MVGSIKSNFVLADIEQARSVAREFAARVKTRFGARVRLIRLYGSAARGDWTPESDVDVLVLLDHVTSEDGDWLVNRAFSMGLIESGVQLQPLFMAESDFEKLLARERLFALDVRREGIDL